MGQVAHTLSGRYVWMEDVDLRADAEDPQTYRAEYCDNTGKRTGRHVSVRIDHDETGTLTGGAGDTAVRVVRGRPRGPALPTESRRDRRIDIRVSPTEEAQIESNAARAGLPVSEYVRDMALRRK